MEGILNAYKRKSELTIVSAILCLLGVVTILWMQTLAVESLVAFFEMEPETTKRLMIEWFMNLASGGSLIAVGLFWIGSVFKSDYYYIDEVEIWVSRLLYLITGVLLIAFGSSFLHHIYANLLILVFITLVVYAMMNSKK